MWRTNTLEKTLMLGKIEGKRRRRQQRKRWLDSITDSMDMNLSKLQEIVEDREAWRAVVHGIKKSQTRLREWTSLCFITSTCHWSHWPPLTQHCPGSICGGKSRQMENFHRLTHLPYFHKWPWEPELLGLQNKSKEGVGGCHVHFCMGMEWGMEKWCWEHPVECQLSVFQHVLFQRHQ